MTWHVPLALCTSPDRLVWSLLRVDHQPTLATAVTGPIASLRV